MNLIPELFDESKDNEKNLIRLWRRKHDNNIALYFFEKYKDEILNVVYVKFNNKFTSVPFQKEDLFHIVWTAILKSLKVYDLKSNSSFKSIIINKIYWLTLREAEKFLNNAELVMNTAYSYERLFEINHNFNIGKNGQNGIDITYQQVTRKFIEDVVNFNEKYDSKILKQVIYLRSLGYTIEEISQTLNLKTNYIKKLIYFACKIAKKLYD